MIQHEHTQQKRICMFNIFKSNPINKLNKQYQQLLTQGMEAQRGGDIRKYAELTEQAEKVYSQIKQLEVSTNSENAS